MEKVFPQRVSSDRLEGWQTALPHELFWFWELDFRTNQMFCSPELNAFLGIGREEKMTAEESLQYVHFEDRERVRLALQKPVEGARQVQIDYRIFTASGVLNLVRASAQFMVDAQNKPIKVVGFVQDIAERKQADEDLRESEERNRSIVAALSEGVVFQNARGQITDWNDKAAEILGLDEDQLRNLTSEAYARKAIKEDGVTEFPGEDYPSMVTLRTGERCGDVTIGIHHPERGLRWLKINSEPLFKEGAAKPFGVVSSFTDITEQKEAEEALRLTQHAVDTSTQSIAIFDAERRFTYVNDAFLKLWGYGDSSEVLGRSTSSLFPDPEWADSVFHELSTTGDYSGSGWGKRRDGSEIFIEGSASAVRKEEAGEPIAFLWTARDITALKRAELQLRKAENRFSTAQRIAGLATWEFDSTTGDIFWSKEMYRIFDLDPERDQPPGMDGYTDFIHPDDRANLAAAVKKALDVREPTTMEYRIITKLGNEKTILGFREPQFDERGNRTGIMGTTQDISALRDAEEATARLGRIIEESLNEVYMFHGETFRFIQANRGARENLGYSMDEIQTLTAIDIKPDLNERQFTKILAPLLDGSKQSVVFETVHKRKDGSHYPVEAHLQLSTADTPPVFFAIIQDITDRKEAEQRLHQAQKMEVVGQLTGGIAHDFNNLLAVSLGNLELALEDLPADSDVRPFLSAGVRAGRRGEALTQQLLAFSRRQTLMPQPTDVNALTEHMLDFAKRTLGGAIEIVFEPSEDLWQVNIDAAQLENALLNLAINARDAMPDGGTLTIRTQNLSAGDEFPDAPEALVAGDYVVVDVEDTGTGMSEDVREKVFEPFFTTKEVGEGSGLGLSMVYGFVKQSGGHVEINSNPGDGTAIRLCLPRSLKIGEAAHEARDQALVARGSGETVLIVEDDPDVRKLAVSLVEKLGYMAIETSEAESALEIMSNGTQVDLVLSDVVLGKGMSGVELANRVREKCPSARVLLMSGYASETFAQDSGLGDTYELIGKPFGKADLARKIDGLLH